MAYTNVTEEVWRGRMADPAEVKRTLELRFKPVRFERLYGMVPQTLYDLRGSPLLSCARLNMYAGFTFKDQFGMIPGPIRAWWHGLDTHRVAGKVGDIIRILYLLSLPSLPFPHPQPHNPFPLS
ncbi:MAG: hypothetical protein JW929_08565 [Anaerolineales bacterium]|nr:hypothetical protein [Anaerolineales bacterium]